MREGSGRESETPPNPDFTIEPYLAIEKSFSPKPRAAQLKLTPSSLQFSKHSKPHIP